MNAADIILMVLGVGLIAPFIVGLWLVLYMEIKEELTTK